MTAGDIYLARVIKKYKAHDIAGYPDLTIPTLKAHLKNWASGCYVATLDSGSRAKGTAISLASDVDYLVSLTSGCHANSGGLKTIYESLFTKMNKYYPGKVRKQNVSIRIKTAGLEIDITPAKKHANYQHYHSIWLSKLSTWKQTNVQTHINDVSKSGRIDEIKLLKIWRELHSVDFPSIYLEYLLIKNILSGKSKGVDYLASNFLHVIKELAKDTNNPLNARIVDPANTANILSDLLTTAEKDKIKTMAKVSQAQSTWGKVVW